MLYITKTHHKMAVALLAALILNLVVWTIEITISIRTNGLPVELWKQGALGVLVVVGLPSYLVLIYKVNQLRKEAKLFF